MALKVKGYISESGEVQLELPANHPVGEVTFLIKPVEPPLSEEEIRALITPEPKTAGDILDWLQKNPPDPETFRDWPDTLIVMAMRRMSIWDVYMQIVEDVRS
jgi:hypothetical protein